MDSQQVNEMMFAVYSGILANNQIFASDVTGHISYQFDCPEFEELRKVYKLDEIAGDGSDFSRAKRLLHYLAPKLTHCSWYDNHIECNALRLLEYSLNKPHQGINCLNKSKILQECCMALGIYARRVRILPYSPFDGDNHVVTEVFDREKGKWIMLDATTDGYFVDENKTPLSVLEIREQFAKDRFATFVRSTDAMDDLQKSRQEFMETNWYIAKNLFWLTVESTSCFGEAEHTFIFRPQGFSVRNQNIANLQYRLRHLSPEYASFRSTLDARLERCLATVEQAAVDFTALTEPPMESDQIR